MNKYKHIKRAIKSYFTLKFIQAEFVDAVSGEQVSSYRDCFGDVWLKSGRWSFFRVIIKSRCGNNET